MGKAPNYTNPIYPYRSNTLSLEDFVEKNRYLYRSQVKPHEILSTIISQRELSDRRIDSIASQAVSSHPELTQNDSYYVLREGILTDTRYAFGNLLISVDYNFARRKPRVRVIGKKKRKQRAENVGSSIGVLAIPLTITNFRRFVSEYLRRTGSQDPDAYTGYYEGLATRLGKPEIVTSE